jgi:hypothetical protein
MDPSYFRIQLLHQTSTYFYGRNSGNQKASQIKTFDYGRTSWTLLPYWIQAHLSLLHDKCYQVSPSRHWFFQDWRVLVPLLRNYAPTLQASSTVIAEGYQQVLWLYNDQIVEVGASNIFFIFKDKSGEIEIATPDLEDLILPGITRDSILVFIVITQHLLRD